jgi:hypothetical protein
LRINFINGENEMDIQYKGFRIVTGAECDDQSGMWNGRYRILDDKGIVAYESFVKPCSDQKEAVEAAKKSGYQWIDAQ